MQRAGKPLFTYRDARGVTLQVRRSVLYVPAALLLLTLSTGGVWIILTIYAGLNVAILLHEWGHALGCRLMGVQVRRITVSGLGGLCEFEPTTDPAARAVITAAGPLANLFLLILGLAISALGTPWWLASFVETTIILNVLLLALNLIPVMPRDGGFLFFLAANHFFGERVALRITGAAGLLCALLWVPLFLLSLTLTGLLILYWVPLRLHWHMLRHAVYAPGAARPAEDLQWVPPARRPNWRDRFRLPRPWVARNPA